MTTLTKRLPIFAVPTIDQNTPNFTETLRGLVVAGESIDRYLRTIQAGRMPDSAAIDATLEGILFFVVPGDKNYAREYLRTCTMLEFAQCVATISASVNALIQTKVAQTPGIADMQTRAGAVTGANHGE